MRIVKRERYGHEIPWLLRKLGCTRVLFNSIEFTWGYVTLDFGLELRLDHSYEFGVPRLRIHPGFLGVNVELPFLPQRHDDVNDSPEYGFQYFSKRLWWYWGRENWTFRMPWDWEHVRHEVMTHEGWKKPSGEYSEPYTDGRIVEEYPYTYTLHNGTVQDRTATIYKEQREWRLHWFRWLPYPRMIRTSINVSFDQEVGEGTGSWKGGCVGCSYDMYRNETMRDCLERMERHREFNR